MIARSIIIRDAFLIIALCTLFFSIGLGKRPYSDPDEGRYVEIPREMVVHGDYITPHLNGLKYFEKPPLFYWVEAFAIRSLGLKEHQTRTVPVLFGVFGCLVIYFIGLGLFGRRVGWMSSLVLASSWLYFSLTRVLLLDLAVSVLLTTSIGCFACALQHSRSLKRRMLLYGFSFFLALSVLTKGLMALVIVGSIIVLWLTIAKLWKKLFPIYFSSSLLIFLAVALPWHWLVARENPEFLSFYFIQEHFLRYLTPMHNRYQPAWFFLPVLLLGFMPWTPFLLKLKRLYKCAETTKKESLILLICWPAFVLIFFSLSQSKLIPYMMPAFPPLALCVGFVLNHFWSYTRPLRWEIIITALIFMVFLPAYLMLGHKIPADVPSELFVWTPLLIGYAFSVGVILIINGFWLQQTKYLFALLLILNSIFLGLLNHASQYMNRVSPKEMAAVIAHHFPKETKVITYKTYYQSLPVYLQKRIMIYGWLNELQFGATLEPETSFILPTFTALQKTWQTKNPVCILTRRAQAEDLLIKLDPPALYQKDFSHSLLVCNSLPNA